MSVIKTPLTEMFKIQHPILLAGVSPMLVTREESPINIHFQMNVAAGPELAGMYYCSAT
jgi:hypothetical protein